MRSTTRSSFIGFAAICSRCERFRMMQPCDPYALINALSAVSDYYGDRGGAADVGTESTEPCGSTTVNF
jgi:hypothetical protein